jgi:2-polyprenyl-6-methoxyphenol hydroxylase-like FAD-dependent oxidoreductase
MALEDADTLTYALTRIFSPHSSASPDSLLSKWERHRMARIEKVSAFTSRGGAMRKANLSAVEQMVKEWVLWVVFWWVGPGGGAEWMYEYCGESVLGDIS